MDKNFSKSKGITFDVLVFLIGNVLAKAVQFFLLPLFTAYMSTDAYGSGELINNFSELLLPFATLCIYDSVFRFSVNENNSAFLNSAISLLMRSAIICGVAVIAFWLISKDWAIVYLFVIVYLYSLKMILAYYIRGKGKSVYYALSGVINAFSLFLFSSVFLVLLGFEARGYLASIALAYMVTSIFLLFGIEEKMVITIRPIDKEIYRKMLKYSTPLIIYNTGYWITNMSGRYAISIFSGVGNAGIYLAAMKIATIINMIQQAFFMAFQLNGAKQYDQKGSNEYFDDILTIYLAVVFIFGGAVMMLYKVIARITLHGDFYSAVVFLPVIILGAIVDCFFCYFKVLYSVFKRTKRIIISVLIGAIVNVFMCVILVPQLGILGACISSIICFFAQGVFRIFDTRAFIKIRINWVELLTVLFGMVMQMFLYMNGYYWEAVLLYLIISAALVVGVVRFWRSRSYRQL
ncbi:lipopolysaccharide biosynthesis protein [Butyrivibrio sp. INlla14]|uniref:lipopolysaccharide biosynthesis protein n=1 Tax=Butyrivibrio sp. INlla14 TaxID=1520808 RepID=UPI0008769AC5|nr:polysaccharide biosynthesis C-terminal domain-containing protein [Butyrivibrio sp. INlla14]SCY42566.1 Membrane protein involved in the export of O-antigen and teichoic acid [Butyrivibrio sp. INlla14]